MEGFVIYIASEYSDKPGGRWKRLGPNSGEDFYDTILLPRFENAIDNGQKLYVYLDGVKSYPSSFLDQSFGELARNKGKEVVNNNIVFKTTDFQWVVDYIKREIWDVK